MIYTVNQVNPLGEYSEKYGQRYWGHVHESDYEVSFNLMNPVNIEKGDTLSFDEKLVKESKSGREYLFLRKVKVNDSGSQGGGEAKADSPERLKSGNSSADTKYLKDVTDIPMRFMQTLLQYYDPQRLIKDPQMYENYIKTAESLSADALTLIEKVRSGSFETKPKTKTPGLDKARATADRIGGRVTDEFNQADVPNFEEEE